MPIVYGPSFVLQTVTETPVVGTMGPHGPKCAHDIRAMSYRDPMTSRYRTLRMVGLCWGPECHRKLWEADGGTQGAEVWGTASVLDPAEYDMTGPRIGLCLECANDQHTRECALRMARRDYWRAA